MTVREAAKHFRKHPATIRRYIRDGCPTVELGSVGRTHGSRLDLQEVAQWLVTKKVPRLAERSNEAVLALLATALDDWLKRDGWAGHTIPAEQAALVIYERVHKNLTHQPLERKDLPPELERVHANYLDFVERGTFHRRS